MRSTAGLILVVFSLLSLTASAQTRVTPPKNKYTPEQDVEIGLEAAAEVRREYPVIDDQQISRYLARLGDRLVDAAPTDLKKPVFKYSFTPVNLSDINAFALPGGPMFVNRGMIAAASSEGQVAGVMAHELSHVLLRHGTANATKAQGFQIGALAGAIAGALIGGNVGEIVSQGTQFGLGTWLLKYSREYEKDADLLGAQIMARAGYDPRDLAHMFETIEKQGGGSAPQWLSSHPNPGNRTEYITAEAAQLRIGPRQDDRGFFQTQDRFASLPAARSMADLERNPKPAAEGAPTPPSVGTVGNPVPPPSRRYRTERGVELFTVSVPDNWQTRASNNDIKFVPPNAYGPAGGQTVMTHGVELGVARSASRDLRAATQDLIEGLLRGNPGMRVSGGQQQTQMSKRAAIRTGLEGDSVLGGAERVDVYTTHLADGNLFYYIAVVPARDARAYASTFNTIYRSIKIIGS